MFITKDILSVINNTLELEEPVRDMSEVAMTSFCDMEEFEADELEDELV